MKQVYLLIVLLAASSSTTLSQIAAPSQRASEKQKAFLEKQNRDDLKRIRAINLIDQTAGEAALWNDREAAIAALTMSADLRWGQNPEARVWLSKAWDLVERLDEVSNSEELRQIWQGSLRSPLRTKILNVALRHDPQLAERLLQKLEQNAADDRAARGVFDDRTSRSEQLLRLALDAIESNPSLALNLAERSLRDGVSFNLQTVLLLLRQKDVALANRLFDSALVRLMSSPAAFSESQVIASYLFKPGQVVGQLGDGTITVAVIQTPLPAQSPAQSDPSRARSFLMVVHRRLMSEPLPVEQSPTAAEFVLLTNSLAQPFQIYAPELWIGVAARRVQFAAVSPTPPSNQIPGLTEKVREAAKNGASSEDLGRLRVNALEEAAERESTPLARKLKFAEAALATTTKDIERGRELAGKIENDARLREQIMVFLYYRAALTCFAEDKLEKAEELALRIPSSLERALALIAIAQKLAAVKPQIEGTRSSVLAHQRAVELLFEAEKSLKREDASANIAKVRLGKTAISYLLDSSQALIDFEQAIAVINRLERFDPTDEGTPRLGIEGFAAARFTAPPVSFGFGFRNALEPLIKEDFDRTASAIDGIASPSVRGLCRLEAARQVLAWLPKVSVQAKAAQSNKTLR